MAAARGALRAARGSTRDVRGVCPMSGVETFIVVPRLPENLEFLGELAHNLWWCWNHDATELLRRIDRNLWVETNRNPVKLLGVVSQERLEALSNDDGFLAHMHRVEAAFRAYMDGPHWFGRHHGQDEALKDQVVAYFSLEYGLTESIPIYSGGLGVLAGDHLKSSSDLGLPLVAVGLLYHQGYFRQYLNADGWQQEQYPETDFYNIPIRPIRDDHGEHLKISVELDDRLLHAQLWRAEVGRVPLVLLDTNIPENSPHDRKVTATLYGGDRDTRIRQEILLGIGGLRALRAIGITPRVCHMNEGHSAFLVLEQLRLLVQDQGLDFQTALEVVSAGNVFTTHTPVAAGNERFEKDLIERYFHRFHESLGLGCRDFLALGRENEDDDHEPFCMTVLALKTARHSNGVSRLHGKVSRHMWQRVWPGVPEDEIPISHITNGVHTRTWISNDLAHLYDTYLGPDWIENPDDPGLAEAVHTIPDEELWRTHTYRRERLVAFARRRLRLQLERRGLPAKQVAIADEVLDPNALTIGFARRFATYKRGTLIFKDMERLKRLLLDRERPVQLIFAGKAHPMDNPGKELIRQIIHFARDPELRRRIVFIEDYDMRVARVLVQGVDVWLNTPLRPKEASGTSGMKAAANGVLNLSVLDGWWDEGYSPDHGWAIGSGEAYQDLNLQDLVESQALYDLLEQEVIPLFYARGRDRLPRGWIRRMKQTIMSVVPFFNTWRMVKDYFSTGYGPAANDVELMSHEGYRRARELAAWKAKVRAAWDHVRVRSKRSISGNGELNVGDALEVEAVVELGGLDPDDVRVELFHGPADASGNIQGGAAESMSFVSMTQDGAGVFKGVIVCDTTGRHGYTVRILPRHPALHNPFELFLVRWS